MTYRYDVAGRMVERKAEELGLGPFSDPVITEQYVYDGDQQAQVYRGETGELLHRYVWGLQRDELLVDEIFDEEGQLADTLWAATDHLGSVNQLLDENGEIIRHREFSSFGELDAVYDSMGNNSTFYGEIGYAGKMRDAWTGLYNNSARWYDPTTGRFISEDPAGFAADGPNLYRYAKNDPVNFRDPSGLSSSGNPLNNLALDAANAIGRNLSAGPARPSGSAFSTVTSIGSALSSAAVSGLKALNPTANSVIKTGLGLGLGALGSIPPSHSSLIREITPGSPIVPQSIENVPGVRGALENPNRYQVSNHGDLGYIVYDRLDGSAKYVSGDQYQTLYGAARQAENAAENAAGRARLLTLTQEVLVTASFIHETGRDLSIAAFGHDYLVEPNSTQSYTTDERLSAFRWATMPGGNSRQAKAGDEVLEFLQQVHKNSSGGRLGNATTRQHVRTIATELENRGYQITGGGGQLPETYIPSATGTRRGSAYPDISATRNDRTIHINTVDTLKDAVTPTAREGRNAAKIRTLRPDEHLILIPKKN